ncbi:MAG: hypothetical protein U1E56_11175 [Bauldia sp.]
MSHDQLAGVFPDGKTLYIPADGKPLAGYNLALAEYKTTGIVHSVASLGGPRATGTQLAATTADGSRSGAPARLALAADDKSSAAPMPRPAPERRDRAPAARTGSLVADAVSRAPTSPTGPAVLAFAADERRPDPLEIVTGGTQRSVRAPAGNPGADGLLAAASPVAGVAWQGTVVGRDMLAALSFPGGANWTFWSTTGSTRQAAFAEMTLPDLRLATPLNDRPQRTYVARFAASSGGDLRTDRFDFASPIPLEIADFGPRPTTLASR